MIDFFEKLDTYVNLYGDRTVFRYETEELSYREMEELSARIYHYLRSHGIGRDDMVYICLPRGTGIMVSVIGVMKAGAAFVIIEDDYPVERISFIKNDCSCKVMIDKYLYAEMMKEEPLYGHEKYLEHDAFFAVYTSGTTGTPKGVIHEYGKIDAIISGILAQRKETPDPSVFVYLPPTSFVAFVFSFITFIYRGSSYVLVPVNTVKNPRKLYELLSDCGATDTFMPPSMIRITDKFPEGLVNLYTGSEPCNGVYRENVNLITTYASTELGQTLTTFVIDRFYEKTPAGKNHTGTEYYILDENGNRLPVGEKGEICAINEYTRGYINLPDKTKEVFIDGIYHTRDLGYIGEDGNLYVSGRMDDMIKINGNRVEPGEIEVVIRREFGIENVVVKGFLEKGRSFLAAFFLKAEAEAKNIVFTQEVFRDKLSANLPYYMIPTYYVVLDEFPKSANGKIDRKKLDVSRVEDYAEDYVAPETETQKYFCDLFARILKAEKVGVNDDFYLIGGDSLSAIELMKESRYENLSISELYSLRTPGKIAAFCDGHLSENTEERNRQALAKAQPLTEKMELFADISRNNPESLVLNVSFIVEIEPDISIGNLEHSLNKVLKHHPVFSSILVTDSDGNNTLRYEPERFRPVRTEFLSDEEFEKICGTLCRPFTLFDSLLYHIRLFKTPLHTYLLFDVHHLITDGTSLNLLVRQILTCAIDDNYVLPADNYFLFLQEYHEKQGSVEVQEIKNLYNDRFQKLKEKKMCINPKGNLEGYGFDIGYTEQVLPLTHDLRGSDMCINAGINVLFMTALALTMAYDNGCDNVFLTWISNGRNNALRMNETGLLIYTVPMFIELCGKETVRELFEDVREQVSFGMANPYVGSFVPEVNIRDAADFLLQTEFALFEEIEGVKKAKSLEQLRNEADSLFEFLISEEYDTGNYYCIIEYSANRYSKEKIDKFIDNYSNILQIILAATPETTLKDIKNKLVR